MTWREHRTRVETNALRLERARELLDKAHLQLVLLGDAMAAYRVKRIIISVETERQRWLSTID
ncbi:MAG: hypothetical protein ACREP9_17145, partial [Candidatus Dormibacteraceae bacterium]